MEKSLNGPKWACHGRSQGRTFAAVLPKKKKKKRRRRRGEEEEKKKEEEEKKKKRVISAGSTLRTNCTISFIQEYRICVNCTGKVQDPKACHLQSHFSQRTPQKPNEPLLVHKT
jgi:predicted solute-binding protein